MYHVECIMYGFRIHTCYFIHNTCYIFRRRRIVGLVRLLVNNLSKFLILV